MSRRRSTIHDAAALRLHPNGVRLSVTNGFVKNATRSLAHKDARGNWTATDAAGDGKVVKRRKIDEDQIKDLSKGLTADSQKEVIGMAGLLLENAPVKIYKGARANRRVAFEKDLTFLAAPTPDPEDVPVSHLQPSSDFLKCIHHFASQYYYFKGELFDSAGQYRREKKEKQRQRKLRAETSGSQEDQTEDEDDGGDDQERTRQKVNIKDIGKQKKPRTPKENRKKDMYKAFDGSALLCIGMLLQAHISSSVADAMPDV
ncbi:hypothetical protein K439DRAFT_1628644 [Ramaria rubella]|nr:hypothetical protein K439DRAFT_1628644 [Ramaria rubella]